jgi:hypothetical protein
MTPTEEATLFLAASRWVTLRSVEQGGARTEALEALGALLRIAREIDGRSTLRQPAAALEELVALPGVAAVYQGPLHRTLYVVMREHGDVSRARLLDIEQRMSGVELTVRAHQGRDPDSLHLGERVPSPAESPRNR